MTGCTGSSWISKRGSFRAAPAKWVTCTRITFSLGAEKVTVRLPLLRMSPLPRMGLQAASTCMLSAPRVTRTHWVAQFMMYSCLVIQYPLVKRI